MDVNVSTTRRVQVEPLVAGRRTKKTLCPACRQLGSTFDCTEQLSHGRQPMNTDDPNGPDDTEDPQELYAVVSFAIPVQTGWETLREQALRIHDDWLNDPARMLVWLQDNGMDIDLQIHLPSEVPNT